VRIEDAAFSFVVEKLIRHLSLDETHRDWLFFLQRQPQLPSFPCILHLGRRPCQSVLTQVIVFVLLTPWLVDSQCLFPYVLFVALANAMHSHEQTIVHNMETLQKSHVS